MRYPLASAVDALKRHQKPGAFFPPSTPLLNTNDEWIWIWMAISQARCSWTLCCSFLVEKARNVKWLYFRCGRGSLQTLLDSVLKCPQQEMVERWKLAGVCFGLIAGTWLPPPPPFLAALLLVHFTPRGLNTKQQAPTCAGVLKPRKKYVSLRHKVWNSKPLVSFIECAQVPIVLIEWVVHEFVLPSYFKPNIWL